MPLPLRTCAPITPHSSSRPASTSTRHEENHCAAAVALIDSLRLDARQHICQTEGDERQAPVQFARTVVVYFYPAGLLTALHIVRDAPKRLVGLQRRADS